MIVPAQKRAWRSGQLDFLSKTRVAVQGCMDAIRGMLGVDGMRRLWVLLLKQHSADPVGLQWLPLLACWLSSTVGPQPVQQEAGSDQARVPASAGEQQRRTPSPTKPSRSPTRGTPEEGQKTASTSADRSQHEREAADGKCPPSQPWISCSVQRAMMLFEGIFPLSCLRGLVPAL